MHNGEHRWEPKIDLESLVWLLRVHDQLAEAWLDLAGERVVPIAFIHLSAWNRNSANFAFTEFSEVALVLACPHNSPVA